MTVSRLENEGFGFVIISSVSRAGSTIGRIIPGDQIIKTCAGGGVIFNPTSTNIFIFSLPDPYSSMYSCILTNSFRVFPIPTPSPSPSPLFRCIPILIVLLFLEVLIS